MTFQAVSMVDDYGDRIDVEVSSRDVAEATVDIGFSDRSRTEDGGAIMVLSPDKALALAQALIDAAVSITRPPV